MLPPEKSLPAPGLEYLEIECAKQHGGWFIWCQQPVAERAKLLAHELHKNMRTHYEHDVMRTDGHKKNPEKPTAQSPWSAVREKFFGANCVNVGLK